MSADRSGNNGFIQAQSGKDLGTHGAVGTNHSFDRAGHSKLSFRLLEVDLVFRKWPAACLPKKFVQNWPGAGGEPSDRFLALFASCRRRVTQAWPQHWRLLGFGG
ncbi:hypothetical protein B1812_05360 [Methylocystis bryophila]|uniref:Uncharacterized protein n=1 Tax=Methylocystis bryophila TaxID=655015 RepID=A0A1W6MSR2_9HYPH|nr:hypothetical protein B1812_05360 [Methylocystis bryophila]